MICSFFFLVGFILIISWIPILRGKRVVLAGDHCQLPPTIKSSNHEVQKGLSKTMFERIMEYDQVSRMLQIQYRMNENIANWASEAMYHGKLLSHDSVKARKLHHLSHVEEMSDSENSLLSSTSSATLLLIDTAGCDMYESVNASGSRYNEGEAAVVERHIQNLLKIGLKQEEIAIITPYNGQVEILKNLLLSDFPKLEIRSVDGFQGGEREAVVLSLVRSSERNGADGIGFLRDKRRLNVAVTRAKRQCAVICDSDTVSQNKFLKGLVNWMEEKGEYFSAMEYSDAALQTNASTADVQKLVEDSLSQQKVESSKRLVQKVSPLVLPKQKVIQKHESIQPRTDMLNKKLLPASVKKSQSEVKSTRKEAKTEANKKDDIIVTPVVNEGRSTTENKSENKIKSATKGITEKSSHSKTQDNVEDISKPTVKDESINSLLGSLAKERQLRNSSQPQPVPKKVAKKKKKSKGGKKLGGQKPKGAKEAKIEDDGLDDLAFLDAQIESVQNSHGRKVEASGRNYKSIVNGILIAKPKPQEKKKDTRAAGALNAKLKQAQSSRKAKSKKK